MGPFEGRTTWGPILHQRYKAMNKRIIRRMSRLALSGIVLAFTVSVPAPLCLAQAAARKVVKTQADLPRFNYKIAGTATELLQSSDATFGAFAARVKADVASVL